MEEPLGQSPRLKEDMIEHVARAIYAELSKDEYVGDYAPRTRMCAGTRLDGEFDLAAVARAAIEAMREPTEAMISVADRALGCEYAHAQEAPKVWRAMIDAALTSSEPKVSGSSS